MTTYIHTIVVQGSSRFPVDMLRYDQCFPYNEKDSHTIETTLDSPGYLRPPITVTLCRVTSHKLRQVTDKRWESFGWEVMSFEVRKLC